MEECFSDSPSSEEVHSMAVSRMASPAINPKPTLAESDQVNGLHSKSRTSLESSDNFYELCEKSGFFDAYSSQREYLRILLECEVDKYKSGSHVIKDFTAQMLKKVSNTFINFFSKSSSSPGNGSNSMGDGNQRAKDEASSSTSRRRDSREGTSSSRRASSGSSSSFAGRGDGDTCLPITAHNLNLLGKGGSRGSINLDEENVEYIQHQLSLTKISCCSSLDMQRALLAIFEDDTSLLRSIIKASDSGKISYSYLLRVAVALGHIKCLKFLCMMGGDVKSRGKNGCTSLHIAAKYNRPEVCKLLIECGVDINARADDDVTALDICAMHGFDDVVEILLGDCQFHPIFGKSDLYVAQEIATTHCNYECIKFIEDAIHYYFQYYIVQHQSLTGSGNGGF
eukprot:Nk52_evm117s485 gene=Nk52_evmTU117s485